MQYHSMCTREGRPSESTVRLSSLPSKLQHNMTLRLKQWTRPSRQQLGYTRCHGLQRVRISAEVS